MMGIEPGLSVRESSSHTNIPKLSYTLFKLGPVYQGQFGEVLSFLRPTIHTTFSNAPTLSARVKQSHYIAHTFDENKDPTIIAGDFP